MRVGFFAKVKDRSVLERVEFYKQDIDILRELGFEVVVATRFGEITADVDFYFVWWWQWGFVPMWKSFFASQPCVITGVFFFRSPVGTDYGHRPFWQRWLMRYALKEAKANLFVSEFERKEVTRALKVTNPLYVPHGVDSNVYREGKQARENFILSVAGMEGGNAARKCLLEVIQSLPLVRSKHPTVRLVIAGEKGNDYPYLESEVRKLKIEECVEFAGAISREAKIDLMQRCKVYVSPSRHEGFGLAILEAMSCGAPVVSSPVAAVPEVVGDTALLVDGTSPEAIASAVCLYLGDDALRQEAGRRSRHRAEVVFPISRRREGLQEAIAGVLGKGPSVQARCV